MKELSDFKNYLVFDCLYKSPTVNTLDSLLEDYNILDDTELCKHCFYGDGDKTTKNSVLHDIVSLHSKRKTNRKNSGKIKRIPKKNKTHKK